MNTSLSLASVLSECARRRPDKLALVEGEHRITFAQMWDQARTQAGALIALGIRPGDKVALIAPNTAEFPRAYYAILAAGAVVVPVHLLLTAPEMAYVLRDSGARLVLCHSDLLAAGTEAATDAGLPLRSIGAENGTGQPPVAGGPAQGGPGRLEDVDAEPLAGQVTRAPEDPAVVFYTSGTTGSPKGAVLSHLNLVLNATVSGFENHPTGEDDRALGALPLFHTFGQTVSMNSVWRTGATLVLLPRFDGAAAIELMVRERVTVFHGVPTMYIALLAAARDAAELPRLRLCVSGGAALPRPTLEKFNATFGTEIQEGYGLSETSPTATVNQHVFGTRAGTVGHPIWGVDVEIADAEVEGRIDLLPAGTLGEIVIRGHNVFTGYLDRPEDTAAAVVDGWFRTGDLGTKDEAGFLTIVDRKKDLIIRGGFNIYPREVEEALLRHPAVAQAAVIGVPSPTHGEEICAVLVLDPTVADPPDAAGFVEWSKQRLGRHKYPRRVEFVDEFPLGPSHKVLKRELRQRYR